MKTRKTILCITVLLIIFNCFSLFADETGTTETVINKPAKNEFSFSYGYPGSLYLLFSDTLVSVFSSLSNTKELTDSMYIGEFNVGYNFWFSKYCAIGASGSYEYSKRTYKQLKNNTSQITETILTTALANFKVMYGFDHFKIYHGLGLGATYYYLDYGDWLPAVNLQLVGLKYQLDNGLSFFFESNLGTSALLAAGVSYRF